MESDPKTCRDCGIAKLLIEFGRDSRCPDGHKGICKACEADRLRRWRQQNPEKYQAQLPAGAKRANKYYHVNRETVRAKQNARGKDPEVKARKAVQDREYREVNKERLKIVRKRYAQDNAEARRAYHRANWRRWGAAKAASVAWRRAMKKRATPTWVDRKALREVYAEAKRIALATGAKHHVDHIVPLVSPIVCGLHVPWNLQILPYLDNHRKSNKVWPDMPEPDGESQTYADGV